MLRIQKNTNTPSQELLRRRLANTEIFATAAVALQRRSLIVSCLVMSIPPSADQSKALQIYYQILKLSYTQLCNVT